MTSPDLSIPDSETYDACETAKPQVKKEENKSDSGSDNAKVDQKRMKMIQLSEVGEISQSVKYIKKASDKVICKLYAEYLYREQDKTNAVLADTVIVKFADLLEMLNTVPSAKDLAVELREDKLLQGNIKTAITFIAPFIPFIGLVTGGATVGKHVMRKNKPTEGRHGEESVSTTHFETQSKEDDEEL